MPEHFLTFELSKDGDELVVHADERGLRFLAKVASLLADTIATGTNDHVHLMTEEWAGNELSSEKRGPDDKLLNHVRIVGCPKQ